MIKVFHRFRSTNDLLDGRNELEKQEIYFASPEKLNDPLEGFKDIFWHGDEIVWKNFLKHYLFCLEQVCITLFLGDEDHYIDRKNIPVFISPKHLILLHVRETYKDICNGFFGNNSIGQYIKNLSKRSKPLRRNELLFIIRSFHLYAVYTIITVYKNHNLIENWSISDSFQQVAEKGILDIQKFNLMDKVMEEHPDTEGFTEFIFSGMAHIISQIVMITRYDNTMPNDEKNKRFIFMEFPEAYIQEIEKLIYPDWYTACFMAKYNNSSVWGHYGDHHKGVCLSFKAENKDDSAFIKLYGINGLGNSGPTYGKMDHVFYKIDYKKKHVAVDFFRSLGRLPRPILVETWYSDEDGSRSACAEDVFESNDQWRKRYWANFYLGTTKKLKDWVYEKEYRLILVPSLLDFSDSKSRKLKYDFKDLESITFGIKTSIEDKLRIIKIIESKCRSQNRKGFKFYQAYYSEEKGCIKRAKMGLIKFTDDKLTP